MKKITKPTFVFSSKANSFKNNALFVCCLFLSMIAKAQCDTPPDQDFGTSPQSTTYPSSLTYGCLVYTGGGDIQVYIDDADGGYLTTSPAFTGNALVIYSNDNNPGNYASFYTENGNEFKMVSLVAEFYGHANGNTAEIYNVVGYKNGTEVARADSFMVTTTGDYGTGASTVNWSRLNFDDGSGNNSGTFTFTGSNWQDVDEIRFVAADSVGFNYVYVVLDDLDFEPASTLGIKKEIIKDIKIYPNPSNGRFIVDSKNQKIQQIAVYNTLGKLVYFNKNSQQNEFNLNLNSGAYFLSVQTESGQKEVFKLMIAI